MRTIFLDFDGPLHPTTAIKGLQPARGVLLAQESSQRGLFCWLPHLEQVLAEHQDVDIVVHSSWATYASNEELRTVLGSLGERFAGITPRDMGRWEGIEHTARRFGLDNFRVIDDAISAFPLSLPELILVDPLRGLSDPQVLDTLQKWLTETMPCAPVPAPSAAL